MRTLVNKNKHRTNRGQGTRDLRKVFVFFKENKTKGRLIEQEENKTNSHTLFCFFFLDFCSNCKQM